ncbi:hypothetical protein K227x_14180 [Rubripirellula lacrimiformis]|uniref:Integrase SAM-like N-terminal domain-containing protein n=1 Tax=Rubripirellula lacrimiformis TaxID=1930273 RepID=A0A517N7B2_9BACT|nr:hypothetical protein K227x_14180 [Rubripirellula lacrimiformis]
MDMFSKPTQAEQDLKWAKIWFKQFAGFHQRHKQADWDFSPDHVIDSKEPDAIGQFRRALRKDGMRMQTERSYVGKVKAFMADRGLTCLADFQSIGPSDVEAHLTDLAVDGNVAASTQNTAFHGAPFALRNIPTTFESRGRCGGHPQACHQPHFSTLLRNPFAVVRHGHSRGSRTARAQRRENHDDLHARHEPAGGRGG